MRDVPLDYLIWLWRANRQTQEGLRVELARRGVDLEESQDARELPANLDADSLYWEMLDAGFRALALKVHPDQGGSTEEMRRLNEARERLRRVFNHGER